MKKVIYFTILSILTTSYVLASDSLRTETANGKFVIVHKVEPGQTLFAISRKYNVSVTEIKECNPGMTQLKTGSEIYIPIKKNLGQEVIKVKEGGTDEESGHIHVVKPGETLFRISKNYNIPVAKIVEANNLGQGGIKVGQSLVIPTAESLEHNNTISTNINSSEKTVSSKTPPNKIEKKTSSTGYPSITETTQIKLDESLPLDFYCLYHATAPVGTIVLLKNKENGMVAHAKIIGKLKTNEIIIANKKVFEKLDAKSNLLAVEIEYTPEE